MKKEVSDKKTARVIFFVTSGIRQDPTCLWEGSTKKFERTISQKETSDDKGISVRTATVKERKGNDRWISEFVMIGEHDLHRIPVILKRLGEDISPEDVAIIGRKYFLLKFSPSKDCPGSRYHWTGDKHPFGWTMSLDRNGERLSGQDLASLSNEIAAVFMVNFEEEMTNGRLNAARRRT